MIEVCNACHLLPCCLGKVHLKVSFRASPWEALVLVWQAVGTFSHIVHPPDHGSLWSQFTKVEPVIQIIFLKGFFSQASHNVSNTMDFGKMKFKLSRVSAVCKSKKQAEQLTVESCGLWTWTVNVKPISYRPVDFEISTLRPLFPHCPVYC